MNHWCLQFSASFSSLQLGSVCIAFSVSCVWKLRVPGAGRWGRKREDGCGYSGGIDSAWLEAPVFSARVRVTGLLNAAQPGEKSCVKEPGLWEPSFILTHTCQRSGMDREQELSTHTHTSLSFSLGFVCVYPHTLLSLSHSRWVLSVCACVCVCAARWNVQGSVSMILHALSFANMFGLRSSGGSYEKLNEHFDLNVPFFQVGKRPNLGKANLWNLWLSDTPLSVQFRLEFCFVL